MGFNPSHVQLELPEHHGCACAVPGHPCSLHSPQGTLPGILAQPFYPQEPQTWGQKEQFVLGSCFGSQLHPKTPSGRGGDVQSGPQPPLPARAMAGERFSEQGHGKGWKGMERERGDARESFPCTAAASAGSGGAEQEQRDGAEPGERDPGTARMEKIPGGLQHIHRPLHGDL